MGKVITVDVEVKVNGKPIKNPKLDQVVEWWVTQQLVSGSTSVVPSAQPAKPAKVYQEQTPWSEQELSELIQIIEKGRMENPGFKLMRAAREYASIHNMRSFQATYTRIVKLKRAGRI